MIPGLLFGPEKLFCGTDEAVSFTNDADRRICETNRGSDLQGGRSFAHLCARSAQGRFAAQIGSTRRLLQVATRATLAACLTPITLEIPMSRLLIIFSPSPPDMDCRTSSGLEGSWGQKYHQESTESTWHFKQSRFVLLLVLQIE